MNSIIYKQTNVFFDCRFESKKALRLIAKIFMEFIIIVSIFIIYIVNYNINFQNLNKYKSLNANKFSKISELFIKLLVNY